MRTSSLIQICLLALFGLVAVDASAQQNDLTKQTEGDNKADTRREAVSNGATAISRADELVKRIEALEKRIAELEAAQAKPNTLARNRRSPKQ